MAKGNTDSFYHKGEDSKVVEYFKKKTTKEKRSLSFYIVEALNLLKRKDDKRARKTKN